MAGVDLVLLEFWNQPLFSSISVHAPKSNENDRASGDGPPVAIDNELNVSDVPFSAEKEFKFLASTSTSLLAIVIGALRKGKP